MADPEEPSASIVESVKLSPTTSSQSSCLEDELTQLTDLLKEYPNLTKTENGQRLKCRFTGHEMAVTLKAVRQYINGKKYAKYVKNPTIDVTSMEQFLKPVVTPGTGKKSKKKGQRGDNGGREEGGKNTDNHKQLYCELTQRLINRDPTHVAKHVQGYRFLREKQRYDDCVRQGIPYVGIVRSKQKNMKKHEDDEEEDDDDDEALEKEKKFSTNPEISDSEEEEEDEKGDDLEDLYPPEDFQTPEDGEEEEGTAITTGSTDEEDEEEEEEDDDDLFPESTSSEEEIESEKNEKVTSGLKGPPFKMQSPAKRKIFSRGSFKGKNKKKRTA